MAFWSAQHHSAISRIQGSASLLLIQTLCDSFDITASVQVVVREKGPKQCDRPYASIDPSRVYEEMSSCLPTSSDMDSNTYRINEAHVCRDGDPIHPSSGPDCDTDFCYPSAHQHRMEISELLNHENEDPKSLGSEHSGTLNDHRDTITIFPGVVYNFSSMMLYFNIHVSVSTAMAIAIYIAVTICGIYRIGDIIQEYFAGCTCRICNREFKIVRHLEGGAYGRIFLAKYVGLKHQFDFEVILKSIPIDGVGSISGTQQECRKLLSLNHRYVMKYYDDFLHREWSWNPLVREKLYCVMVTEFCERGNLADLIESEYADFTEEYILSIFKKVVIALQYVHEQSVIHRDIKSPNIMLKDKDVIRLGDFGLSDTFASKKAYKKVKPSNVLEIAALIAMKNRKGKGSQNMSHCATDSCSDRFPTADEPWDDSLYRDEQFLDEDDILFLTDIELMEEDGYNLFNHEVMPYSKKRERGNKGKRNKRAQRNREVPHDNVTNDTWNDAAAVTHGMKSRRANAVQSMLSRDNRLYRDDSKSYMEQIGTRCYMAPEILEHATYGRASDIWALGCILLELCSGVFMWELEYNLGECPEKVPLLISGLPSMISRGTRGLLNKMLAADLERRPSAAQILSSRVLKVGTRRHYRNKTAGGRR